MKRTTLFRLFAFVLLIGLMASCSKDKPAGPGGDDNGGGDPPPPPPTGYYVKMKMDGATLNYNGTVKAVRGMGDDGTTHTLQIQGIKGNGSTDEVDLIILGAEDADLGEYTEGEHEFYAIFGIYAPQNRADDSGIFYGGIHENAPMKIKISEITSDYIKGTFSGDFYDNEGNGENKKVFTEGEFKAPIK